MRIKPFYKDIFRTLKKNLSRFLAIVVMTALGTGVFIGFTAGCLDVFDSADHFYDKQKVYDIKIASTLGLTDDDLSALSGLDNVRAVFGNNSMDVIVTQNGENQLLANLITLDTAGMNTPYVLKGTLPNKKGQIAVTNKFIHDTGLHIGDTITLNEAATVDNTDTTKSAATIKETDATKEAATVKETGTTATTSIVNTDSKTDSTIPVKSPSTTPALIIKEYKITAIILSPLNISNISGGIGAISFSTSSSDYLMYATKESINSDIYSTIYISLEGTAAMDCYSTEYQSFVENMTNTIKNNLQEERQQARYAEVVGAINPNISMTKWYVWDRSENDSFIGLDHDISFIQAVTKAFPIIFFLVAILISLTTMTRMVEEDRALIGTYKSLGYSKFKISLKYILYALLACVAGGILGSVIGFFVLPKVIAIIVSSLYVLPTFKYNFYPIYGLGGFGLFLFGIIGATIMACVELLHKRPAELMRPKSPKEGSRIFLERFPFLWKRLNFLNKVTSRNLFRYKKRATMTIVGILGCMMLIVLGFGVKDTVGGLMPDQFNKVTVYDAIVVTENLNTTEMDKLEKEFEASGSVKEAQELQITTLTLQSNIDNLAITVMVIPDDADLKSFVHLKDAVTNKKMVLPKDGVVVTQNAAKQLKLKSGDIVSLQNEENLEHDFPVAFVTINNAGNYVYISESCYQAAFKDYTGTSLLLNMTEPSKGQEWLDKLSKDDRILTVNSSQAVINKFDDVMKLINMVVYLLIIMSAVLALTVLFTLSNINISERERELATMKVLGFKPKEVNSYVNKETFILTLIGIILGMPAGYGITYAILSNVSIANTAFQVRVSLGSYLIAAILTLIFSVWVNQITNNSLRRINMVEALKSVE